MPNDTKAIQSMFNEVSLGAPENAVGFVLWRIVQRYQRDMDRALAPLDLTNLQFVTLALSAWFGRNGDLVNQVTLARSSGIQPMQVSLMLRTLESKGHVLRERDPDDTRSKHITVTRAGLKTLRQALPLAIDVQQALFGEPGHPGGKLLTTLRKLDEQISKSVD